VPFCKGRLAGLAIFCAQWRAATGGPGIKLRPRIGVQPGQPCLVAYPSKYGLRLAPLPLDKNNNVYLKYCLTQWNSLSLCCSLWANDVS